MMQINNTQTAKKTARALEKFLAKSGMDLSHGKALDALSVLAGYKDWNSLAYALSSAGIDAQLDDFEQTHIEHNDDVCYGAENAMVVHTGFELRYSASEDVVDYVRVCDPLGREIAYWNSDEWEEDPQVVMGAIIGALVRGRPVEYTDKKKRIVHPQKVTLPEVRIQDVPLSYCSNILLNGDPYAVPYREDRILDKLHEPAGDPDAEDDTYHVAMTLYREDDGLEFTDAITLHTLRNLKWDLVKECFVSPGGDLYEFFIEYKFKPGMTVTSEQEVSTASTASSPKSDVGHQYSVEPEAAEGEDPPPGLYEVKVFALVGPGPNEYVGTWLGSAINAYQAEHRAVKELWKGERATNGSPYAEARRANEAQYSPFKVYLDGSLYAELPYFSMAVDAAESMLEIAERCTVTSFGGQPLYETVR